MKGAKTKLNMVIGYPLDHSLSPALHNPIYKKLKLDSEILPFAHPDVKKLAARIRILSIPLTAVTMPFKKSVISYLDKIDASARDIGAINTIINRGGKLIGYNTDVDGVRYALRKVRLNGKNVFIIGAGGAALAAAYAVKEKGGKMVFCDKNSGKASKLAKKFGGRLADKKIRARDIDVIINATPVGMYPLTNEQPIKNELISGHQTIFDVVYNPPETKLLKSARRKGARTVSGLDMFVAQGLRQIEIWTGKKLMNPGLVNKLKKSLSAGF